MDKQTIVLEKIISLSTKLEETLELLDVDMEQNNPDNVDQVNTLLDQRGRLIVELEGLLKEQHQNQWFEQNQAQLAHLKELDQLLQKKVDFFYQAFARQYGKLQQGKKLTNHYQPSYDTIYTDGVYFDKKK